MRITYGRISLRFVYMYIVIFLFMMMTDGLLYELVFGEGDKDNLPKYDFDKYFIPFAVVSALISLNKQSGFLRNWTIISFTYLLLLTLESEYKYGSYFVYPHVFSKAMVLLVVPALYVAFKKVSALSVLHFISYAICIGFILQIIIFKGHILTASAFVNTERGFPAPTTYLLLIPTLYFFNHYLSSRRLIFLFAFFAILTLIIFLQHRTVWLATLLALTINLILIRKSSYHFDLPAFGPIVSIPVIAGFLLFSFVLSSNPEILTQLEKRIADIGNAQTQGTGNWRIEQFQSYWSFILDNLLIGMRLEGFELPIQFYEDSGQQPWPAGTGHHFHSFYVDRLFYFGLVGLFIILALFARLISKIIQSKNLSLEQIVMASFVLSGLIYGFSYNWSTYFYGILGIALVFLDQNTSENTQPPPLERKTKSKYRALRRYSGV